MNENNLLLILSVLFSRARPKIWWIYIYQIWSADWKTLFGRSKNYFEATFSNSKASFNKKPNSSTPQWTVAKMTYIWFWVHWLAEHTPKSGQYKFTNSCRLTGGDTKEGAKIVLKLLILTWRPVLGKIGRTIKQGKTARKPYIWFWAHWLEEHAPKSDKYQFAKYQFANLVGWLQKTLKNDQKVFLSSYL